MAGSGIFTRSVGAIENAIKMDLPNRVQSVEVMHSIDKQEWIVKARIKGMEGVVTVRIDDVNMGFVFPPIEEIANKLRAFC